MTIGSPLPPDLKRKKAIIVPANEDDDDANQVMDSDQADPAPSGEDDLKGVPITCDTQGTLTLMCTGCSRVRLWKNANRTEALIVGTCWSSCEPNCQPLANRPPIIYVEGIQASGGDGDVVLSAKFVKRNSACAFECICTDSAPLTVVSLEEGSLMWEQAENTGNPELGDCDNNRGKKIFPDLIDPTDGANAAQRRKVDLVATIKPPVKGATVYFKVWDVDDPFDQLNPSMPDVGLIDSNNSGQDNRPPPGEQPWPATAVTGANGQPDDKASVRFTVSMQPGNNYRAGASVNSDATATAQVDQTNADAVNPAHGNDGNWSGYSVPLTWSKMLTVWRKLHVEVDSMSAEPAIVSARSPDWDEFDPINVLDGAETTTFDGVGMTQGGPLAAGEVDHYEGGILTFTTPSLDYPVLDNHSYFNSDWGGTLSKIHCNAGTTPQQEAELLAGPPGTMRDDDPISGQLPVFYSVGSDPFILATYRASYIEVVQDDTLNPRREVPFDPHLEDLDLQTGAGYDNSQDVFSQNNYWASLVVLAYQPDGPLDADPDPFSGQNNSGPATNPNYDENVEFGVTIEDSDNASVIYVEVQRDVGSAPASPIAHDLPHTIAHEIGHAAGPANDAQVEHDEEGLMSAGAQTAECCFSAMTLRRFRETVRW